MIRYMKKIFVFILAIFFFGSAAYAHSVGQSLEKTVGDYSVDIGYDTSPISAGEAVRFDFNLRKDGARFDAPPEFEYLWVRIAPQGGEGILFAGYLANLDFALTGMTYVFPRGGTYELTVRFEKDAKTVAETSFPLIVEAGDTQPSGAGGRLSREAIIAGLSGMLLGSLIVFLFFRKSA